mmetsp:Transcript_26982/g.76029  ORF Transcript_26982/g.76029 Transcript_26982/m.76029 type:complete len:187 (+) Transcript_26982:112-672(+)
MLSCSCHLRRLSLRAVDAVLSPPALLAAPSRSARRAQQLLLHTSAPAAPIPTPEKTPTSSLLNNMGQIFGKIEVEMPKHEVLRSADFYEIRKYPAQVAVETSSSVDDQGRPENKQFSRLASYIGVFGNPKNIKAAEEGGSGETGAKVAMTAPVVMQQQSEQVSSSHLQGGRGGQTLLCSLCLCKLS